MSDSAYVLDAPYTWSFYEYQSPLLMSYAARLNGFAVASLDSGFTYCDLGCGNGVSVNLLASAFPKGEFFGVDFNPEHIENAQAYVDRSGLSNAHFIDASFEQYANSNPPRFDFIAMHGIYSWVSEDVRRQIRNLVDKTLKPGGLVYLCYNTLPGWSELIPLWKMIQAYTDGLETDSVSKARIGLEHLAHLRDNGASYFRQTAGASRYLDRLLARDVHYVAHEFCNAVFEPQYFVDVANEMKDMGLDYAGTAKLHRNRVENIIAPKFLPHVNATQDRIGQESRKSFIRNEFFRRDIYIRDGKRLSAADARDQFTDMPVGSTVADHLLSRKLRLGYRKIDLGKSCFPALQPLAAAGRHTVGELWEHPDLATFDRDALLDGVHDLIAGYQFQPLSQRAETADLEPEQKLKIASPMNRLFLQDRLVPEGKTYMESSVLGSAIRLNLVYGLFLRALEGRTVDEAFSVVSNEIAAFSSDEKRRLGVIRFEEDPDWLTEKYRRFRKRLLPVLLKYRIVEPDAVT